MYYIISVSRLDYLFLAYLFTSLLVGASFALNDYSFLAVILMIVSRIMLITLLYSFRGKIDIMSFLQILFVFTTPISIIVYTLFKHTRFYYASAIATYLLVVALAIAFTRVLNFGMKNRNLELFLATFLFLASDMLFGSKKLSETETIYITLSSGSYLVAYLLIALAMIKKAIYKK